MGFAFFMAFLIIIFFIAVFFIVIGIALIAIWNSQKRKGMNPKKWWRIMATVLLIINIAVAIIPIGYIGFLRYANNSNQQEIANVESGKEVYWPSTDNGRTTTWFEMDGKKYVEFRDSFSDNPFFFDSDTMILGEAIAYIKNMPSESGFTFNDFMWILLSGSTYAEQHVSTLYPIKNNDFDLVYVEHSPGRDTFCEEGSLEETKIFYSDISNYDTKIIFCRNIIYADSEQSGEQVGRTHVDEKRIINVQPGTFERLWEIHQDDSYLKHVKIPDNENDRRIEVHSKDNLATMHIYLRLIGTQVYTSHTSGDGYMNGCMLPRDINQYITDNIFVQTE